MNGVRMKKIVVILCLSFVGFNAVVGAAIAPEEVDSQMRQHPFDYVPMIKRDVPKWAKCGQFWFAMRESGWLEKDVVKADAIMWRESRCNPLAHNRNDPNTVEGVKGSLSLFQINVFWIQSTTYYPKGYLQTVLNRELSPQDLFDVDTTLLAAQALIAYDRAQGRCGWSAWLGC